MKRKKQKPSDLIPLATPKLSKHEVEESGDRVWKRIEAELEKRKEELAWRSLYGDGWTVPALSQDDLQIVTAVHLLGENANGDEISRMIRRWTDRPPVAAVALGRLEKEGLLASTGTGDQFNRFYKVTEFGQGALHRARVEGRQVAGPLGWSLEEDEGK